jgi:Mce-associated membrane protein
MSPRRKLEHGGEDTTVVVAEPNRRWRGLSRLRRIWGLPLAYALAALLVVAALTVSGLMLWQHEIERRETVRDVAVLDYVKAFMTTFTTKDPFDANDYANRVLEQSTGEFAKSLKDRQNELLIRVAQGEQTNGTVTAAGIEKRYDDGSVTVLVATKTRQKTPDGKKVIESGDRWVVRAIKEGPQWKISKLTPVV